MLNMIKVLIVFTVIFVLLKRQKSLFFSMLFGIITIILIFQISIDSSINIIVNSLFEKETIELVLALLGTTLLQNAFDIIKERKQYNLSTLFSRKRNSFMFSSFFIGLLPSPTAILIAAPITEKIAENKLSKSELAFTTNYYRHISEIFLPTYSHIILAIQLSLIPLSHYLLAIVPLVIALFLIPKYIYLNKLPRDTCKNQKVERNSIVRIFQYFWPIIVLIISVLIFDLPLYILVLLIALLYMLINRFKYIDYKKVVLKSLQLELILTTLVIMIFKNTIIYTNIFEYLTEYIMHSYMPPIVIFGILFLLGGFIIGSQGMVAIGIPLAYLSFPNGGVALLVFLMSILFISSLISPTHLCVNIAAQYFKISLIELIVKTIKVGVIFLFFTSLYSLILFLFI